MYKIGHVLQSEVEFDNAVYMGLIISITQNDEHLGSGNIIFHDSDTIMMVHNTFNKRNCTCIVVANPVAHSTAYR